MQRRAVVSAEISRACFHRRISGQVPSAAAHLRVKAAAGMMKPSATSQAHKDGTLPALAQDGGHRQGQLVFGARLCCAKGASVGRQEGATQQPITKGMNRYSLLKTKSIPVCKPNINTKSLWSITLRQQKFLHLLDSRCTLEERQQPLLHCKQPAAHS